MMSLYEQSEMTKNDTGMRFGEREELQSTKLSGDYQKSQMSIEDQSEISGVYYRAILNALEEQNDPYKKSREFAAFANNYAKSIFNLYEKPEIK
jgi:hypothetical protein